MASVLVHYIMLEYDQWYGGEEKGQLTGHDDAGVAGAQNPAGYGQVFFNLSAPCKEAP